MAKTNRQNIKAVLELAVNKELNRLKPQIKRGNEAMGKTAIDLIRDRTDRGIDANGKRLPKLSALYREFKRKFAAGKIKKSKRGRHGEYAKMFRARNKWRARKVPNHGRLSGRTLSAMTSKANVPKIRDTDITASFSIFIRSDRDKIITFLTMMGRNIWGLAKKGTPQRRKEETILIRAFERGSGIKVHSFKF